MNQEIGFYNLSPAYEMSFSNDEGVVAKLKWDKGVLRFVGNVDVSAEVFLDLLNSKGVTQYNELLQKIHQLEVQLSTAKTQNDIYKNALQNK